jgi:hypothetical protein
MGGAVAVALAAPTVANAAAAAANIATNRELLIIDVPPRQRLSLRQGQRRERGGDSPLEHGCTMTQRRCEIDETRGLVESFSQRVGDVTQVVASGETLSAMLIALSRSSLSSSGARRWADVVPALLDPTRATL